MRNKFEGTCYCCGKVVKPGFGFFERISRHAVNNAPKWRVIHDDCVFKQRQEKLAKLDKDKVNPYVYAMKQLKAQPKW